MTEITPWPGQEPERRPGRMAQRQDIQYCENTASVFRETCQPSVPDSEGQAEGQARKARGEPPCNGRCSGQADIYVDEVSSVSRRRTRVWMSSRMGRTAVMSRPAGSGRFQSR